MIKKILGITLLSLLSTTVLAKSCSREKTRLEKFKYGIENSDYIFKAVPITKELFEEENRWNAHFDYILYEMEVVKVIKGNSEDNKLQVKTDILPSAEIADPYRWATALELGQEYIVIGNYDKIPYYGNCGGTVVKVGSRFYNEDIERLIYQK